MRTYTHGAIGYLLYARGSAADRRLAVIGSVLPDAILATGFIFHVPLPWAIVSDLHALLHFSWLHTVTIALHSFVVVGPLLALSWLFRRAATPLFVGMLSHGLVDLITHRTWEYNHFFPVRLPPIRGLVAYTDPGFTILEHTALLAFFVWLFARRRAAVRRATPHAHGAEAERLPGPWQ